MKTASLLFIAALGVMAAATVSAADPSGETAAPGQPFVHPSDDASYSKDLQDDEMQATAKPSDNGDVQYISGGVGEADMNAINAEENAYNLKMLFVAEGGAYLANVGVDIKDGKGHDVLDTTTEGPVLLVKMPPGPYTVEATAENGATLTQHVKVENRHLASYVLRYTVVEQ
ncbi:MAG: hypothetical protein P4M13_09800 [Alphaproteobacteria bacterium]|nr:hypothetical protein [Alphaproteobacteria bacterium]